MDRKIFYDNIRPESLKLFDGSLSKKQVLGMEAIIDAFQAFGDGREQSLAYILATARHEVSIGMVPVRETFAKSDAEARKNLAHKPYAKPKNGNSYYGRGFVQLTHDYNYKKMSEITGVDIFNNPDKVLEPELGARILVEGIISGYFNGNGKGIALYLTDTREDLKNARRTVNVTDRWELIGGYYRKFLTAIQNAGGVPRESTPTEPTTPVSSGTSIEDLISSIDPEESLSTDKILISNAGRKALPKYRPTQKPVVSMAVLEKYVDLIPAQHRDDSVFVLGVRGYYTDTMGKAGANDRGIYDDAMFVIEPGSVHNFNGNTDPSGVATGRAVLKSRQVILYKPGNHGISGNNPYPAFRQDSPCTVIRDGRGEDNDSGKNRFWINLHRGGVRSTSSLGCQTVPPHQWHEFKSLVDGLLEKYDQENFCYLLIDEQDVPSEASILGEIDRSKKSEEANMTTKKPADDLSSIAAILEMLRKRRNKPDETVENEDMTNNQRLIALLLKRLENDEAGGAGAKNEAKPIKNALGNSVGNALDGKKTGLGILGLLATVLIPVLFPENGKEILEAFDLGAESGKGNFENGKSVLTTLFAALGSWGILGKIEKWVNLVKR